MSALFESSVLAVPGITLAVTSSLALAYYLWIAVRLRRRVPRPSEGPLDNGRVQTIEGVVAPTRDRLPELDDPHAQCVAWFACSVAYPHKELFSRARPFILKRDDGTSIRIEAISAQWEATGPQWRRIELPPEGEPSEEFEHALATARNEALSEPWYQAFRPEHGPLRLYSIREGDRITISGLFRRESEPIERDAPREQPYRQASTAPLGYVVEPGPLGEPQLFPGPHPQAWRLRSRVVREATSVPIVLIVLATVVAWGAAVLS